MNALRLAAALAPLALAPEVLAITLYKHVDERGHVTYTDHLPRTGGGVVVPLEVDTSPVYTPPPGEPALREAPPDYAAIIRRRPPEPDDSAVEAAEDRVERARESLRLLREDSTAEDWIYHVNGGRHARPEYLAKLQAAEAEIAAAEAALAEAEARARG